MSHPAVPGELLAWDLAPGKVAVLCATCRQPLRAPDGRLQHQRGRRTPAGGHHMLRLADLEWDELEALGLCECGQALESHPPLPRPRPLSSGRILPAHWRGYMPGSTFRRARTGNG